MSWRQYGGTNKTALSSINIGSVVANQFLTRSAISNINQFENLSVTNTLNITGSVVGLNNITGTLNIISIGNSLVNKNVYFGSYTPSEITQNWSYLSGNSNGISINNNNPQALFHITGPGSIQNSNVLQIDTTAISIRNIIGQNVNSRGIAIEANDAISGIYFYNKSSTSSTNPDSYITNDSTNGFTLSSNNSNIKLDTTGNILLTSSNAVQIFSNVVTNINSNIIVNDR